MIVDTTFTTRHYNVIRGKFDSEIFGLDYTSKSERSKQRGGVGLGGFRVSPYSEYRIYPDHKSPSIISRTLNSDRHHFMSKLSFE